MKDNYTYAAEKVRQFFPRISAESDAINAKIIGYAERAGRITEQQNPTEFDAIITESAADLDLFADRLDALVPDYRRNLELLTEGYEERIKSLDAATDDGAQEIEGMRREAQTLTGTASEVKTKVTALRSNFASLRDGNYGYKLTEAAHRVITAVDALFSAYEDLETFALKVSFSADQK